MEFAPRECPACGSSDWKEVGRDKQGFSVGKAAVGGLLLGPVGLLGGALGKKKATYYCCKCGFSRDYTA